ncbi:MAG: DUF4398 domain-containing protein [Deltaproteobacteria bacterium]|nr:DUF4398 domain-containing protein [Deltaproteobacteria bacterium]
MSRTIHPDLAPGRPPSTTARPLRSWCSVALLLVLLGGCGPIASTGPMLQARDLVDLAKAAGSAQFAMYEFTMAREYLAKAREEWAYSDFQKAREYSDLAADFAKRAMARTKRDAVTTPTTEPVRALP